MDPAAAEAWSRQRLSVRNAPLPRVLDELARHRRELLWFDDAGLADLRISGVFPLDGEEALAALADSLPIDVKRGIPGVIRIERRGASE
ncbi:fec operon regulator FecR [compost metagenome]